MCYTARPHFGGIRLSSATKNIIETENLTYIYSPNSPFQKTAIGDINLAIEEGEMVGVIGHTGSGKSTLIQHLNGLLKPTSGRVRIDGEDIWDEKGTLREVRFKVGLVFQYPEYQLFEETVRKDISFGPKNMGLSEDEVAQRVQEAARFVGLREELLDKSPFELSGGQKRRVAIAGVIAMEPKVLILDEPTAGLDPRGRDRILGQIREYHEERKNTVLLVSHSMEDVAKFATKVLVMNKASVFAYDTVDAVFSRAAEMEQMGLSAPQITKVFLSLREKGYDLSENVYTVEMAKRALLDALERKRPRQSTDGAAANADTSNTEQISASHPASGASDVTPDGHAVAGDRGDGKGTAAPEDTAGLPPRTGEGAGGC